MAKKSKYRKIKNHKKRTMILVRDEKSGTMVARDGNDTGPDERKNHGDGVVLVDRSVAAGGIVIGKGATAVGENIVNWLSHRGYLDPQPDEIRKDERYREARKWRLRAAEWVTDTCHAARLMPRVIGLYRVPTSGGQHEMTNKERHAKKMLTSLYRKLGSKAERLVDVCFFNSPIFDDEIIDFVRDLDNVAKWRQLLPSGRTRIVSTRG